MCLAIKQMLEEVRSEEKQKGKQECLAIKQMLEEEKQVYLEMLVRKLKKFCPDFESLYEEIVQEKQYQHMTREEIRKYY